MKRLAELEARRRALLERSEAQREELSWRLAQLSPRRLTQVLAGGLAAGTASRLRQQGRHPLAWVLAAAALLLLRRPREALAMLARARGALALLTRTAEVLTLFSGWRRRR